MVEIVEEKGRHTMTARSYNTTPKSRQNHFFPDDGDEGRTLADSQRGLYLFFALLEGKYLTVITSGLGNKHRTREEENDFHHHRRGERVVLLQLVFLIVSRRV